MKTCVIFGAGGTGRKVFDMIHEEYEVLCFVDNDRSKWGWQVRGKEVCSPQQLGTLSADMIFVGTLMGVCEVRRQLEYIGISPEKINFDYVNLSVKSRECFLHNFRKIVDMRGLKGAVAEAGVYQGEFAKIINRIFPERTCYLFDTFEGFDEKDLPHEKEKSLIQAEHLKKTSIEMVLSKMTVPENCVIRQGYFPETAEGLEENFCFVNLDMDLYKPILDGLEYFYPRTYRGGVILVHDYFSEVYPNVKTAVEDYEKLHGIQLHILPVGDDISLAIVK